MQAGWRGPGPASGPPGRAPAPRQARAGAPRPSLAAGGGGSAAAAAAPAPATQRLLVVQRVAPGPLPEPLEEAALLARALAHVLV